MDQPTLPMLRNALARCAIWFTALVAFIYLCSYVIDARTRSIRAPDCQWNVVPNPDNAPYLARFCYLTKDTVLLRVYDPNGQRLFVERSFYELDRPRFHWDSDALGYNDRQYDGGEIALPPSLFERLRAKLP